MTERSYTYDVADQLPAPSPENVRLVEQLHRALGEYLAASDPEHRLDLAVISDNAIRLPHRLYIYAGGRWPADDAPKEDVVGYIDLDFYVATKHRPYTVDDLIAALLGAS